MKKVAHVSCGFSFFFKFMLAITLLNSPVLITDLIWHLDIKYPTALKMANDIMK